MKHISLITVLAFALACGGSPQEAPSPPAPAGPPAGPGIATAPDGVSIAYTVSGEGSPALVFVHGWMCDQTYWTDQAVFSETHTVVTIDLAGHGKSGMEREGWPLMAFGADVEAVVEALDLDRVILIGHSMGGPVVLEAARLMPERVIGVVGVDTLQDADHKYDPDKVAPFLAPFENDFQGTCRGLVASMFLKEADPAMVERIARDMSAGQPEIGIALLREYIDYDVAAAFTAVPAAIPIRCINSTMYATNIEGNRAYHEDFEVVEMGGVGHFLMIERPEEFNAILNQVIAGLD